MMRGRERLEIRLREEDEYLFASDVFSLNSFSLIYFFKKRKTIKIHLSDHLVFFAVGH